MQRKMKTNMAIHNGEGGEVHILPQAWGEASSWDGRSRAPNRVIHHRRRVLAAPTVKKHLHSPIGKKILPQAGSRVRQVRTPRHPVQAVLATPAEAVLARANHAEAAQARTIHAAVVLARSTPLVAA